LASIYCLNRRIPNCVLHAHRQIGKTTLLGVLVEYLNAGGNYRAVYANIEGAQTARHNVAADMATAARFFARQMDFWPTTVP
jgi:hypothetical protein